jgi:hypothetical protein
LRGPALIALVLQIAAVMTPGNDSSSDVNEEEYGIVYNRLMPYENLLWY